MEIKRKGLTIVTLIFTRNSL